MLWLIICCTTGAGGRAVLVRVRGQLATTEQVYYYSTTTVRGWWYWLVRGRRFEGSSYDSHRPRPPQQAARIALFVRSRQLQLQQPATRGRAAAGKNQPYSWGGAGACSFSARPLPPSRSGTSTISIMQHY